MKSATLHDKQVSLALRLGVGFIFLIAGLFKAFSFVGFNENIASMVSWLGPASWLVAVVITLAEIVIGGSLLIGFRTRDMFFALVLLVAVINLGLQLGSNMGGVAANLGYIIVGVLGMLTTPGKK